MIHNHKPTADIVAFSETAQKLRGFFLSKGFVEAHTQDRLSILAACEDPTTVATFEYGGEVWPLPQTGQMWLEYELLTNPHLPGVFCLSTSYRNEPHPIPGRHERMFPMFEFESHGTLDDLRALEEDLCEYLRLGSKKSFKHASYAELARHYDTDDLSAAHEKKMAEEFGRVVFLEHFPEHTSPFWNMRRDGAIAHKIDVIIDGMETIGSAERSSNAQEMRERFHTISDGKYAQLLYDKFGKQRVEKELEEFLSLGFFPRFGGGIGMTRLMRALQPLPSMPPAETLIMTS
ncbi:transposase [Candidatus Kaiserbacteria bacterium]|nr:transposase [Candidatus Kaiserbacteria bacterium]